MKRLAIAVLAAFIVLAVIVAINAARSGSRQISVARNDEAAPAIDQAARRLSDAIRFRTVSNQEAAKIPTKEFEGFHAFLVRSYPHIQSELRKHAVNGLSVVYEWPGSDLSLKPILMMAHQDVVPVDAASA